MLQNKLKASFKKETNYYFWSIEIILPWNGEYS